MAIGTGTRVGTFEIEALIGRGGMGEVYRGVDTRLRRPVAIKLMSGELRDAAARRRFEREAEIVSSLNHPHILTVYAVGDHESDQYLVTELVEDGTLQDWVRSRSPSWRQVVELLAGVADGLAAAHTAGILHRDFKPANILVARSGHAKLADFGLAKPIESGDAATRLESPQTHAGLVVGTLAYMSPEQAAGKSLDARSDIFSFGLVLYEAVTRRHPFAGASGPELFHAIIHRQPDPLPADLPIALRLIIDKALANDPEERYQSMRELVVDLRRVLRYRTEPGHTQITMRRRRWPLMIGVGIALVAAVGMTAMAWWLRPQATTVVNPLEGALFTRFTNFEGTERSAAISPDGRFVAFRADREGPLDVWLGQVGTGRFANLTKGIDDEFATDSPSCGFTGDGSEVWLSGGPDRRLRLMPMMGGTPRPFLSDRAVTVAWAPDGARIAYHLQDDGDSMYIAESNGANARLLFRRNANEHNHFLAWSMDGRRVYFSSGTPVTKEMDVWAIDASGGTPERLTQHNSDVGYLTPIDTHTLLYVSHDQDGSGPWLWALDTERKATRRVNFGVEKYTSIAATPDGRRLVATVSNPSAHLWTVPITSDGSAQESDARPFNLPTADASAPRYAGDRLFYLSSLGAGDGVWRSEDGQATEIWKGSDGPVLAAPAPSPDGRRLAVVVRRNGAHLYLLSDDGGEIQALGDTIRVRGGVSWSPDAKWIAIAGSDNAGAGLFKIPVDGGAPVRIVTGAALNPVWSPRGDVIVYIGANVGALAPLLAVRPDGSSVGLPPIQIRRDGERVRFLPTGKALIYMEGTLRAQNFALLDLETMKTRSLTHLSLADTMGTFDIRPGGKEIVFDRLRDNSDIVLIDRRTPAAAGQ